jgi:hypothetical protein
MTNQQKDEFCSTEFQSPNRRKARIQALRGSRSLPFGYFISLAHAEQVGLNLDGHNLVNYQFESGKAEDGIVLPSLRMVVRPSSYLFVEDRERSKLEKRTVIHDIWRTEYKKHKQFGNVRFYEVLLLDEANQPLHDQPFAYTAKGANGATFGMGWNALVQKITELHAQANNIPISEKNAKFTSLCVFDFETEIERVEREGDRPEACKVVSYDLPNEENWKRYFLGYQDIRHKIWEILKPETPLLTLADFQQEQQPVVQSDVSLAYPPFGDDTTPSEAINYAGF